MKKIALLALLLCPRVYAQDKHHEIKWNALGTIAIASVEIGYEYFVDDAQSVGARILINDAHNFAFKGQASDYNTNSVQLSYQFYTGKIEQGSGFYISPMVDVTFGTFQQTAADPKIDMDSFALGVALGHKWTMRNKFAFGPYVSIARNFSDEIRREFNSPLEFNIGLDLGIRF